LVRGLTLVAAGDIADDAEINELHEQAERLLNVSGAAYFRPQLARLRSYLEQRGLAVQNARDLSTCQQTREG